MFNLPKQPLASVPVAGPGTVWIYINENGSFSIKDGDSGLETQLSAGSVSIVSYASFSIINSLANKSTSVIYYARLEQKFYIWDGTNLKAAESGTQVYLEASLAALNGLAASEKKSTAIYVALDTGILYRWSGSAFVTLVASTRAPKVTRFTTSGIWTPDPAMRYAEIEGQGAGGAGNSASSSSTTTSVSAGGGAGGYFKTIVTSAQVGSGPRAITIGAGALASAGGDTTVQGVGTANGGQVGERTEIPQGSQNALFRALPYFARGGNPGGASVTLGQVIVAKRGGVGARGFIQNSAGQGGDFVAYMRGHGGQSEFGSSLDQAYSNASNGQNLSVVADAVASDQYGAGGNGAFTLGNAGANGSAGVGGIVNITEFF